MASALRDPVVCEDGQRFERAGLSCVVGAANGLWQFVFVRAWLRLNGSDWAMNLHGHVVREAPHTRFSTEQAYLTPRTMTGL